jgi:hypothetical protein
MVVGGRDLVYIISTKFDALNSTLRYSIKRYIIAARLTSVILLVVVWGVAYIVPIASKGGRGISCFELHSVIGCSLLH